MASTIFNKIPAMGDGQSITLPFTAPSDGFIAVRVNPASMSGANVIIMVNGVPASIATSNGNQVSTTVPVKKGGRVAEASASQAYTAWFIPFV